MSWRRLTQLLKEFDIPCKTEDIYIYKQTFYGGLYQTTQILTSSIWSRNLPFWRIRQLEETFISSEK